MDKYNTNDLVGFALNGKPIEFTNTANDILNDKINNLIDAHRAVVAKDLLNKSDAPEE